MIITIYFVCQRDIRASMLIFLASHCFANLYLHYQTGAQAVYTWRHRESLENSDEILKEIRHLILSSLVLFYIVTRFIFNISPSTLVFATFNVQISYVLFDRA